MLVPAITRKQEVLLAYQEYFYSYDMFLETGSLDIQTPTISDNSGGWHDWAIISNEGKIIGYLSYYVNWYESCVRNFGLISFDRGNPQIGRDLFEEMNRLINKLKLHRIEWRMIEGNPVQRTYDRFCEKYGGRKIVLTDAVRDAYGKYHNVYIYEIVQKNEAES